MKALFLSVVFLHLLILIQSVDEFEFGDIIAFPRKCRCNDKILYKHYALYVDNEIPDVDGDIIHRVGFPSKNDINFDHLKDQREHHKENIPGLAEPNKEEIKNRIKAVLKAPGQYRPFKNNCEHLVTYLRTGEANSKQSETIVGCFPCFGRKKCSAWDSLVKEMMENEELEANCNSICEKSNVAAG